MSFFFFLSELLSGAAADDEGDNFWRFLLLVMSLGDIGGAQALGPAVPPMALLVLLVLLLLLLLVLLLPVLLSPCPSPLPLLPPLDLPLELLRETPAGCELVSSIFPKPLAWSNCFYGTDGWGAKIDDLGEA